ncbi:CapA family protein [Streptomyces sp. RPA4-5]|uniref:CapA family protein n=1 Tax=Streptomyces TaxID=1883 RepID=UPI00143EB04C|nr:MULTISPECIES: CapA family protein [Streptomyces]MCX4635272.1 CapA family protein [Streptomyces platensis]QIY58454.1 CapA family protein [Streptomyces sp. RPA4-5]WJY41682.1 CapA family protein [Streptomyces sp. P9-2B-2]
MTPQRRLAAIAALTFLAVGCGTQQSTGPARSAPSASPGGARVSAAAGFTLLATGDVLPHGEIIRRSGDDAHGDGHDFRAMFAGVKPVVSGADLAICHMETIYGRDGGPFTGYPSFKSPPQVAAALKDAGYDSCSTASNHTLDDGADGVHRTLGAMDAVGLRHAGSARSAAEASRVTLLRAGPAKVAQLSYTYGTNGIPLPSKAPWTVNVIDREKILTDARAARRAGADVVVVSIHWGTEWQQPPDEQQRTLARALTAARTGGRPDIDLILGTHAHVPQPYEKVNGTWVVYGMGDQLAGHMFNHSDQPDGRGNQSSMARFTFAGPTTPGGRWTVRKAEFLPQLTDVNDGFHVVNLNAALTDRPGRSDYARARDSIREIVLSRGAAKSGLMMAK